MHIEIATKTSAGLQLQAFFVDSLSVSKDIETGRAALSVTKWPMPSTPETWEAYESVMGRCGATPTGLILRISTEDLAAATAAAGA